MPDQSRVESAPDSQALLEVLRELRRDLDSYMTRPYVNVGGRYRLEVDGGGNLVATHGPTGRQQIIMTP